MQTLSIEKIESGPRHLDATADQPSPDLSTALSRHFDLFDDCDLCECVDDELLQAVKRGDPKAVGEMLIARFEAMVADRAKWSVS